jgi:hypothetical protein
MKTTVSFSDSSIILFLRSLSKEELKQFDKFIKSPFHNNRSDVVKYFNELKKFYPLFGRNDFTKQNIFSRLYPNAKYKDDVIRRLSSNLLKAGEEFGAYISFRKDDFTYNRYLSEFYLSKSIVKLLNRQLEKTELMLNERPARDAVHFLNRNFLEEFKRLSIVRSDSTGKKIDVQLQIDSIWKFAAISLFRLYKIAAEHSRQFEKKYNTGNLRLLYRFIEENGCMESKALEIWYLLLKFQSELRNDETFLKLKKIISVNAGIFGPVESFVIYVSLMGYCFDKNIDPKEDFTREEFEIMKEMLDNGLLIQDNVFHPEWFIYAVITSLRAKKTEFAEKLINTYSNMMPENVSENVLYHAKAELEIEKGNFEKALEYLTVSRYNNIAEKLRANHMYIKIYYELGLSDQFFYNIDSFRHLIKNNNSLTGSVKMIRENFIKFSVKLFRIKINESKEPVWKVKKEILNSKITGNKWLLKKADELKKLRH